MSLVVVTPASIGRMLPVAMEPNVGTVLQTPNAHTIPAAVMTFDVQHQEISAFPRFVMHKRGLVRLQTRLMEQLVMTATLAPKQTPAKRANALEAILSFAWHLTYVTKLEHAMQALGPVRTQQLKAKVATMEMRAPKQTLAMLTGNVLVQILSVQAQVATMEMRAPKQTLAMLTDNVLVQIPFTSEKTGNPAWLSGWGELTMAMVEYTVV
jgi:hypothetical protein